MDVGGIGGVGFVRLQNNFRWLRIGKTRAFWGAAGEHPGGKWNPSSGQGGLASAPPMEDSGVGTPSRQPGLVSRANDVGSATGNTSLLPLC